MDLNAKLKYAKAAIDSIVTHDDAPAEAVKMQGDALKAHIDMRMAEAHKRRMAAAGVAIAPGPGYDPASDDPRPASLIDQRV